MSTYMHVCSCPAPTLQGSREGGQGPVPLTSNLKSFLLASPLSIPSGRCSGPGHAQWTQHIQCEKLQPLPYALGAHRVSLNPLQALPRQYLAHPPTSQGSPTVAAPRPVQAPTPTLPCWIPEPSSPTPPAPRPGSPFSPAHAPQASPLPPLWAQHGDTQVEPDKVLGWGVGHLGSPHPEQVWDSCPALPSKALVSLPHHSLGPNSEAQNPMGRLVPQRGVESSHLSHTCHITLPPP